MTTDLYCLLLCLPIGEPSIPFPKISNLINFLNDYLSDISESQLKLLLSDMKLYLIDTETGQRVYTLSITDLYNDDYIPYFVNDLLSKTSWPHPLLTSPIS